MSDDLSLKELVRQLAEERGVDLGVYKNTTLERRVRKRMHEAGAHSYAEYLEKLRSDNGEVNELLNTVLINVTEFFRDPPAWEFIHTHVLRDLLGRLKPGDSFRAWSAGCASGEEPYSLGILVADHFGPKIADYDIKIYATDIDDEALNVARRGEYPIERLRLVRPEWRERYFQGQTILRITRDLRRMVIFGRSNLVSDAPISHCSLVICRNVLIYLDVAAQRQVLTRLHYALEPSGVLFLGKAESKLSNSEMFRPLNGRWRIFQRIDREPKEPRVAELAPSILASDNERRLRDDMTRLRMEQQLLLDTVQSGIISLDAKDCITACNDAAQRVWGVQSIHVLGKRLQSTDIVYRCPELAGHLEAAKNTRESSAFQCVLPVDGEERVISVTLRSVPAENGERVGMIMNCDDITSRERLQATVEQLEATGEELQSANEELETTNEELQSTNEELETTNEELQSTNEELETTNEELQSLNEELENMNQELESRSRDLNALTSRYEETLKRMPWPVVLVDRDLRVQLWNSAAQRLFGVVATSVAGVELEKLPSDSALIRNLVRRSRGVIEANKTIISRSQTLRTADQENVFDVQFTPASRDGSNVEGVLIMFGPFYGQQKRTTELRSPRRNSGRGGNKPGNRSGNKSNGRRRSKR